VRAGASAPVGACAPTAGAPYGRRAVRHDDRSRAEAQPPGRRPRRRAGIIRSMWIDTHCHLDAGEFAADRDAVVARARAAGVETLVLPAVAPGNFATVRELAHRHGLAYALGIHPLCVGPLEEDAALGALRDALAAQAATRGWWRWARSARPLRAGARSRQAGAPVRGQLRLARDAGLPVLLHVRRSADTLLKHLRRLPACRASRMHSTAACSRPRPSSRWASASASAAR
jgi:TatD DNase family protein